MNYPIIKRNFLESTTSQLFVDYLKSTNSWEACSESYWNKRSLNLRTMPDSFRENMLDIRLSIKQIIMEAYDIKTDLYCDIFQFVRWIESNELLPHADSENPDGSPHPYSYREFSSIIYLNDDYEGGQIHFPNLNFEPKVHPGDLVIFPGTLDYLHGVTKITSGTRYTIAGFFTTDKRYHDGYRI
jgi:predicted 2-oxoglutarate/Fe(II)-dependent dioxygenase YbiX